MPLSAHMASAQAGTESTATRHGQDVQDCPSKSVLRASAGACQTLIAAQNAMTAATTSAALAARHEAGETLDARTAHALHAPAAAHGAQARQRKNGGTQGDRHGSIY